MRLLEDMALARGSSPLARGLLMIPVMVDDLTGIIPARAGFTSEASPTAIP